MSTARAGLTALRVAAFRNYETADLALDTRHVVLFGPNGAGKTNLLEAVSCLAPGRGLRRAATEALARRAPNEDAAAAPWAVSADLALPDGPVRLGVGQDPAHPSRRMVRIDGAAANQAELGARLRVSWLTPAQDRVFAGPRGERMRFFDRLVLACEPQHGPAAARYERAMRERTKALETGGWDPAWIAGLEAEMAARGVEMAAARRRMLDDLQAVIDARPEDAFPKADLTLDGAMEERLAAGADAADVETRFAQELADGRRRDAAAGRALEGPHRADLAARHRGNGMPAGDCSTGEQKALLVGLALAHAQVLAGVRAGAAAAVLLDEAVAHLDAARRAALVTALEGVGAQAWLTGTDALLFADFAEKAQRFEVTEGRAEPRP